MGDGDLWVAGLGSGGADPFSLCIQLCVCSGVSFPVLTACWWDSHRGNLWWKTGKGLGTVMGEQRSG